MKPFKDYLISLNACDEAIDFVSNKTFEQAYNSCERGDWLLWLFAKTNHDDLQPLILAKGHCANTVRYLMKDERSIKAVDTAIAFGEGKATLKELNTAAAAAAAVAFAAYFAANVATNTAYAANAAANAANTAYAAANAAYAANAATNTAYAAYAAANAANAAYAAYAGAVAADAADAAAYSAANAKKQNQRLTADICRKYLPIELWNIKL